MQIDMHYYGTYAMARAAGLNRDASSVIATSSQFVDDNMARDHVKFRDGSRINKEATAHHVADIENLDEQDQRRVWVPFHFLPGNVGQTYTERLKCRMDSPIAQEMRDHHLSFSDRTFALQLLGIAAHVYADTFSHYGFSGVSSRGNRVDKFSFHFHKDIEGINGKTAALSPDIHKYITQKMDQFFGQYGMQGGLLENIKGRIAEELSGALGHGAVATLPDRPYLVWNFKYERPDAIAGTHSVRDNPVTYLAGCRALHSMFKRFADMQQGAYGNGDGYDFEEIESKVDKILRVQADKAGRIQAWKDAASSGEIFGAGNELFPEYEGDNWNKQWEQLDGEADYQAALELPVWRFYQAASLHRIYVLRDLLPEHRLIVN